MSVGARLTTAIVMLAVAVAFLVWVLITYLLPQPGAVAFAASPAGQVNITAQTVGSIGFGDHPTWVSYLVQSPSGSWVHSTVWRVPGHTRVNVTIEQFDSGSPLRNQQWGMVTGTLGDVEILNGKPIHVYDSNSGNGVGHTFAIPALNVSVPLVGVDPNATNVCGAAPCSLASNAHNIIKFSFMTQGPGDYSWQCFVPCGLGYLYGNGGPMSTLGYMGGFLQVTE